MNLETSVCLQLLPKFIPILISDIVLFSSKILLSCGLSRVFVKCLCLSTLISHDLNSTCVSPVWFPQYQALTESSELFSLPRYLLMSQMGGGREFTCRFEGHPLQFVLSCTYLVLPFPHSPALGPQTSAFSQYCYLLRTEQTGSAIIGQAG